MRCIKNIRTVEQKNRQVRQQKSPLKPAIPVQKTPTPSIPVQKTAAVPTSPRSSLTNARSPRVSYSNVYNMKRSAKAFERVG